jgi:hypothetical protein
VARAEFEASRLGMRFDEIVAEADGVVDDGSGPMVVVRRFVGPDDDS